MRQREARSGGELGTVMGAWWYGPNASIPPLNYRPLTYEFQKVLMVALADCHRPLRKNRNVR